MYSSRVGRGGKGTRPSNRYGMKVWYEPYAWYEPVVCRRHTCAMSLRKCIFKAKLRNTTGV